MTRRGCQRFVNGVRASATAAPGFENLQPSRGSLCVVGDVRTILQ